MGRPPGSKNKPKNPDDQMALPGAPMTFQLSKPSDIPVSVALDELAAAYDRTGEPASVGSYALDPVGVKVVIHFRAAMSAPTDDTQEMDWPAGWPVPQLNDVITVMKGRGGRVRWLEYDLGERIIHIYVV